jgi:ABC-type molybdenum transport system ATPase subunit/photorepair protein PhrA
VEGRNILFDIAWDVDRGRYLVLRGETGSTSR